MAQLMLIVQGVYYIATGLWALVHMRSFEMVTGPKRDTWLVKTVGALVLVVGWILVLGGVRRRPAAETVLLATGSATALAAVETYYAARGRISPVYLADACGEVALVGTLLRAVAR